MNKKIVMLIAAAFMLSGCKFSVDETNRNYTEPPEFNELDFKNWSYFSGEPEGFQSSSSGSSSEKPESSKSSASVSSSEKPESSSASSTISVVSFDNILHRNNDATVKIKAQPNTEYSIDVFYSSGASTAKGLENKVSDENGIISWTWHVGGRTKLGTGKTIKISGGGDSITLTFSVED